MNDRSEPCGNPDPAGNSLDRDAMRGLWQWALDRPRVDDGDNFFSLGGQSLAAVVLIAELADRFGRVAAVETVYEHPVFREFWAHLSEQAPATASRVDSLVDAFVREAQRRRRAPLSFQQLQVWTAYQLSGNAAQYNLPIAYEIHGALDASRLRAAFDALARRHSVLRTTYGRVDGEVQQTVCETARIPFEAIDLSELDATARALAIDEELRSLQPRRLDIERSPPLLVRLIRASAERSFLLICVHHIAFDGWSLKLLIEELGSIYDTAHTPSAKPPRAVPEPVPYLAYALHAHDVSRRGGHEKALQYFRRYLDGVDGSTSLPTDFLRSSQGAGEAANEVTVVPARHVTALASFAASQETTPFVAFFASLALALSRQACTNDVVVGVPTANRDLAEFRQTIGFFANTVALRLAVDEHVTLGAYLRRCSDNVQETLRHAHAPFPLVVEAVRPARSAGSNPIFQIAFAYQNAPAPGAFVAGTRVAFRPVPSRYAKFDLTVSVYFNPVGDAHVEWEYDSSLFARSTVRTLAARYEALLSQLPGRPERRLSEINPVLDWETSVLQRALTGPLPQGSRDPVAMFRAAAQRAGDKVAVRCEHDALSYAALDHCTDVLAAQLRDAGAGVGMAVGFAAARNIESIVAQLAILKSGAACLPIDLACPASRIEHILRDSASPLFIRLPGGNASFAANTGAALVTLDLPALKRSARPARLPQPPAEPGPCGLMYTSGSTGEPKGVWVPAAGVARLVRDNGFLPLDASTVMLHAASPSFDAATFEVFGALLNGGTLVCYDPDHFDIAELARTIRSGEVNTMWLTAGLLPDFAELPRGAFPALRWLVSGGDVVSPRAVAQLHEKHPQLVLVNGYGPTENTTFTTCHRIDRFADPRASIPIGRPIAGTRIKVVGRGGMACAVGQPGELWTTGAGLAGAYHNAPALSAERFVRDGSDETVWYRTGDRVRLDTEGRLEFLGRIDTEVKIRGFRVDTADIERRLLSHPDVKTAAVVVSDPAAATKSLVGFVVPRAGAELDTRALRSWLSQSLPSFAVPQTLHAVAAIAANASGKLDRAHLQANASSTAPQGVAGAADFTPSQAAVARLWAELLGSAPLLRPDSEFFDVGGNSLMVLRLATRLGEMTDSPVSVNWLYNNASLDSHARLLRAETAPEPAERHGATLTMGRNTPRWIAVPGVAGLAHAFADVGAQLVKRGASLAAFDSLGLGRRDAVLTFDAAVAGMTQAIRAQQARGPYLLMGHSFGGRVVFEVAAALEERGDHATVLLLDTLPGNDVVDVASYRIGDGSKAAVSDWLRSAIARGESANRPGPPASTLEHLALFSQATTDDLLERIERQLIANRHYRPSRRLLRTHVHMARARRSEFGAQPRGRIEASLALHAQHWSVSELDGDHFDMLKVSAAEIAALATVLAERMPQAPADCTA